MRDNLLKLIKDTIIYKYDLPNHTLGISKTIFSTDNDKCYFSKNKDNLVDIIYNSILDYSFNEFDIKEGDLSKMYIKALKSKIKYNDEAEELAKIKYGFFGEVLLYSLLVSEFNSIPLISRGYFYNPLEFSETKGYDSYHLIEKDNEVELWFGEAKFHSLYKSGTKSIISSLDRVLSNKYLETNLITINTRKNDFNLEGSKIEKIIKRWDDEPEINLIEELLKESVKLIYPILILYEKDKDGYDKSIENVIKHIEDKYSKKSFSLSVDYSIFFIFLPLEDVRGIKSDVIKCIESKKPLI